MDAKFITWMHEQGYTVEDFAERKAELQAEYQESRKVRGRGNQKRRARVRILSKDGDELAVLPEMDYRKKDALLAAALYLTSHASELGLALDSEDINRCKVVAETVTVTTEDCGHVGDAFRS